MRELRPAWSQNNHPLPSERDHDAENLPSSSCPTDLDLAGGDFPELSKDEAVTLSWRRCASASRW